MKPTITHLFMLITLLISPVAVLASTAGVERDAGANTNVEFEE